MCRNADFTGKFQRMSAETKGMILGILGVTCFGFGFGFGLTLPATRLIIS